MDGLGFHLKEIKREVILPFFIFIGNLETNNEKMVSDFFDIGYMFIRTKSDRANLYTNLY